MATADGDRELEGLRGWMRDRGWTPLPHQERTWRAQLDGASGLVCVPTGSGKTYAAYFGALAAAVAAARRGDGDGLRILWITPLRAMARDIELALARPVADLGLPVTVASRIGDTSSHKKRKLRERLPTVLLTTPESLCILLSYDDAQHKFAGVHTVVVDEWHELAGTKRGTQTELALARLRTLGRGVRTWALSATLGNVDELAVAVAGPGRPARVVRSELPARVALATLGGPAGLPWFGYLGATMFDAVADALDPARPTLLFTNTRNQAERWYRALLERRPEWFERFGLHHGSIDGDERDRIERGLRDGSVTLVVCTSSLDLGVDFAPVERVVQIGSARGVARLLQRAGRARHRPGEVSEVLMVPTHAMQLVEIAALRRALAAGEIEPRRPLQAPVDVLAQHLVTCAAGGGFAPDELFAEVRTSHAYRDLDRATFDRVLAFVERGGPTLAAYPRYHRIVRRQGRCVVADQQLAREHRAAIGTITQDGTMRVRFLNGHVLGSVEERFLSRVRPGERFLFGGRVLELVSVRDMDVRVRAARGPSEHAPKWVGGRLPLSDSLATATRELLVDVRTQLEAGRDLADFEPEVRAVASLLRRQHEVGRLPGDRVLAEVCRTREGEHLFLFPFAGRLAHEGLAALLAFRLGRRRAATFALSANDYGLELLAAGACDFVAALADPTLWSGESLDDDALRAVNAAELSRRQFREVARVAGLVHEGFGRHRKGARQLQTSAGLLHDVFARHEPGHLLLSQARDEVLQRHFDRDRLAAVLARVERDGLEVVTTARPSPLAFPLALERVEARVSSETARQRLERMKQRWLAETVA